MEGDMKHRKLKIEECVLVWKAVPVLHFVFFHITEVKHPQTNKKLRVNSCAVERLEVPVPPVAPIVLL
jgi:hypothetical protein